MPVEVVPHMYRMLADEIQWACDDGEPYRFSHLLVISRTFTLSEEEAETALASFQQQKRRKGVQVSSSTGGVFSFHHEDQCIQELSSHSHDFLLSNALPRDKESFGLEQGGRLILRLRTSFHSLSPILRPRFPSHPKTLILEFCSPLGEM